MRVYRVKKNMPTRKVKRSDKEKEDDQYFKKAKEEAHSCVKGLIHRTSRYLELLIPSHASGIRWHNVHEPKSNKTTKIQLLVAVDENENIVLRTAKKEVVHGLWKSPMGWAGDLQGNGYKCPLEWLTQTLVSTVKGETSVLKVFERPAIDEARHSYAIYLEYAPCFDLERVRRKHAREDIAISKPFLLMAFKQLVEAGLLMKQGSEKAGSVNEGWKNEIIHVDLKVSIKI